MVVAVLALSTMIGACDALCCVDKRWNLWALNDSDQAVVMQFNGPRPIRVDLPAHSYLPVDSGGGAVGEGWTVSLVDAECRDLQTVQLAAGTYSPLFYITPDGRAELRSDAPWINGLKTATGATAGPSASPCPV